MSSRRLRSVNNAPKTPNLVGTGLARDAASNAYRTPVSNGSLGMKTAAKRTRTTGEIPGSGLSRDVGRSYDQDPVEELEDDEEEEHPAQPAAKKRKSQQAPFGPIREILRKPDTAIEMAIMTATHSKVKTTMNLVQQFGEGIRELHLSQATSFEEMLVSLEEHIDSFRERLAEKADVDESSDAMTEKLQCIEDRIWRVEEQQRVNWTELFETLHELKEEIRDRSHGPVVQVYNYGGPPPFAVMPPR